MLPGYKCERWSGEDTSNGSIYREGGLYIEYEYGPSEGQAAHPNKAGKLIWCKEQTINQKLVRLALAKPGVGTLWKPKKQRGPKLGDIFLVTFPLGGAESSEAINFYAEIRNPEEIAEVLLMVLTYDPSK